MDAALMFEVLLYLNAFYFGVFCISEMVIVLAKYFSPVLSTPNIDVDGSVLSVILTAELIKLLTFRRMRETSRGFSIFVAILMTTVTIAGLLYVMILQNPVLKMEYMVCAIMFALMISIVMYGFLQFLPCCQKQQYV